QVPHVLVVDKPVFLGPEDLKLLCASGKKLDLQLLAVPWVSRSGLMAYLGTSKHGIWDSSMKRWKKGSPTCLPNGSIKLILPCQRS
ncbi:MAG: hypothetical protein HQ574_02330, partial [Chloroflexi bacterium]|nr:hypothetical protein [Chloroflexota bacterium]